MAYNYEYEFDGYELIRWHLPSEKLSILNKCSDEFTAINRAKRDFARLANMAKGKGRDISAVWHYGGGRRLSLNQA